MEQNQNMDPNTNPNPMGTEPQAVPVAPQAEEVKEGETIAPASEAPASETPSESATQ